MQYKIEGGSLPILSCALEPGEAIISEVGGRAWTRGNITTETTGGGGAKKMLGRMFSGESLFMSKYTAQAPSEITFTSSFPGAIKAIELAPGQAIICQKSSFLCATDGVDLSIHFNKKIGTGIFGGEGFIMQKITGPGIAFVEVDGYASEYTLAPGERIVCDTGVLVLMDESCSMDIEMVKGLKNKLLGGEGLIDTVVTGPGKVCLQSMSIEKLAGKIIPYLPSKD